MKEFMLLIRNEIDHQALWSADKHEAFLKACERYIDNLTKESKLISAQPLVRDGYNISGSKEAWKNTAFNESKEVIVGYYHVLAKDLDEAIAIAKGNPEFEYGITARIEVRPVKMKEESTGFEYPKQCGCSPVKTTELIMINKAGTDKNRYVYQLSAFV